MAGIFQVFGDLSPGRSSTDFPNSAAPYNVKTFKEPLKKPKGLSMRSNSDLNVPSRSARSGPVKVNFKEFTKPTFQSESHKNILTPKKPKVIKKQGMKPSLKQLSPKILSPVSKNINNDVIFKRPTTPQPKQKAHMYPQPEGLAPYLDEEHEFFKNCVENLELEFLSLKMSACRTSVSNDDEGFVSDEQLETPINEDRLIMTYSDDESVSSYDSFIELPDITDFDDIMD